MSENCEQPYYQKDHSEKKIRIILAIPCGAIKRNFWILRWRLFGNQDITWRDDDLTWSQLVIEAEIEAHWALQRQIYLQEEVKALEKTLLALGSDDTGATESLLLVFETELEDLKHSFKDRAPRLWELEGGMPVGTLERDFRTCRNNPDWYLCRFLRQDCAGCGDCCARGCGCCDNKNRGHCTTACGCCIRTHGRSGDLEDGDLDLRGGSFVRTFGG
ncbi:uncharacterized protein ASPGLDRAFT_85001 [Aspergillus glaucus CBS 516.65]|uniref:Uncharacterized protein n=1 Tax=Aspergillus glaucus CBS 516.65 TaxID=1160497 RepID=A0A1L9V981_ASPGL|nr:hypothetical protein ASPGLDRAFT_85001 [Aspergillus glaucus CBS 516.65]OJJ80496.1 hypothetical protein ASPGLDRAFT_85001 [Aspergillus glaucus CBS 516.65]